MTANIETTLAALSTAYGIECPADPQTAVTLWKGKDDTVHEGWHIATEPDLELLDEQWAPSDDDHAEEVARLLG